MEAITGYHQMKVTNFSHTEVLNLLNYYKEQNWITRGEFHLSQRLAFQWRWNIHSRTFQYSESRGVAFIRREPSWDIQTLLYVVANCCTVYCILCISWPTQNAIQSSVLLLGNNHHVENIAHTAESPLLILKRHYITCFSILWFSLGHLSSKGLPSLCTVWSIKEPLSHGFTSDC